MKPVDPGIVGLGMVAITTQGVGRRLLEIW
jgi:hypothetical protein